MQHHQHPKTFERPEEFDAWKADAAPLDRFSWYLAGRVQVLLSLRTEILEHLDKFVVKGETNNKTEIKHEHVSSAERLSWLWLLGAYEVVRTMCQARDVCFSEPAARSIQSLKRELARARIPAAKMEQHTVLGVPPTPVPSGRSPCRIDIEHRDLLVGDPGKPISLRTLLDKFVATISKLRAEDIVASHESSYTRAG